MTATVHTIPANGTRCLCQGRCGESTGWHYIGSEAHKRCQAMSDRIAANADRMRDAVIAGNARAQDTDARERRPLRRLEVDETDLLESMRSTALAYMPFYSHLLYKVRPVAVDEEPLVDEATGEKRYELRAGLTEDWRLLVNFAWVRDEFDKSYETYGDMIRQQLLAAGVTPTDHAVRRGTDVYANIQMAKVLLHEMGHAMYDSWKLPKEQGYDAETLNRAEDAVINGGLRLLGANRNSPPKNEDINGEFLENAVYGGSIECNHDHAWNYRDPKTGETSRRCVYDETTQHYYDALKKMEEDQRSQQGSQGDNEKDTEQEAGKGQNSGDRTGDQGGSDRGRDSGGGPGKAGSPGQSGRGPGNPTQDQAKGGNGETQSGNDSGNPGERGCGKRAAEKYADDPLEKGTIGDDQKQTSLNVTADELERWANDDPDGAKAIGFGSGSMARKWANYRRRTDNIRWDAMLTTGLRRTIESAKTTRETYAKTNRRDTGGMGIVRRGTKQGFMPKIAVAIDTSGSMSDADLFMAYNSTRSVMKRTGITSVDAFAVDSQAQSLPVKIRKPEDLAPLLKGGGGTNMCAGIEVAAKNGNDVCVVLTDGEVPWEQMRVRPQHIPTMKVVIGVIAANDDECRRLAAQVPSWMQTVRINKELLAQHRQGTETGTYVG